jgi:RHS repeat-associated protein
MLASAAFFAVAWASCANAQSSPHPNLDKNGVDLTTGLYSLNLPISSIGSGDSELPLVIFGKDRDNWTQIFATRQAAGSDFVVNVYTGNKYDQFSSVDGYGKSTRGTGATLQYGTSQMVYHAQDGTIIEFNNPVGNGGSLCTGDQNADGNYCTLLATNIVGQTGDSVVIEWDIHSVCPDTFPEDGSPLVCSSWWRVNRVGNTSGYAINFAYEQSDAPYHSAPETAWFRRSSATFRNDKVSDSGRVLTYSYPSNNVFSLTTPGGRTWSITQDGRITGIRRPGASADTTAIAYTSSGKVSAVTQDGVTTQYNHTVSGNTATMVVTNALGQSTTIVSDVAKFRPTSITDALQHQTTMVYDSRDRLLEKSFPDGDKILYEYDDRDNVTKVIHRAKPGSGLPDQATSAGYSSTCDDAPCGKPVWTRDAKQNQTDYTYTGDGLLESITLPPPSSGGVRPQTRYAYSESNGFWRLSTIASCATTSSCVGTADETRASFSYDSNGRVTSVTRAAGNGAVAATVSAAYDTSGNVVSVDGPSPGSSDTTSYSWSSDRELVAINGPDPDGGGPLKRIAKVFHYLPSGQRDSISIGTTDANGGSFSASQQLVSTFDGNARKVGDTLSSGSTTYAVTHYGYDAVGRPQCTAVRMDPSQWGGLSDACAPQTSSSNGPDRVTKQIYDAVGQVTGIYSALGTAAETFEQTSYTSNGKVASVTDGNGNVTTMAYDGLDRLLTTTYPGGSYEQLGYDANSNVTSRRLRDGQTINYGYDALDRLTSKDRPNSTYWETDQSYAYDNFGHLKSASDSNGRTLSFEYDALGRKTSQSDNWYGFGNATFQYDAAGRRTRSTWNDGNFVSYDYRVTGEVSAIRDGAGNALVSFGYDDLGRRQSLSRANGTVTSYDYDPVSRLHQLAQDLAGSANDQTVTFEYNPAGQISSRTGANDGYAWSAAVNADRSYSANSLNQYTQAGTVSFGYDGRGNLTDSGGTGYGYTVDNQLATSPNANLAYDPLGRLFNINAENGVNTTLVYDGPDVMAETDQNSGALLRRYVYGPGTDEPLIWYEGAGLGDRRWLHADERGSIVAVTNDAGNAIAINRYDEFGIPQSGNIGRFQYTGQKWLPSLGLYDYKARMYSPTLGRFLQTDPIGYGDGLNWYNYVGGDPVNFSDPTGLRCARGSSGGSSWTDADGTVNVVAHFMVCWADSDGGAGGDGGMPGTLPPPNFVGEEVNVTANPPQRVTVDPSCAGIPAVANPAVQKAALNALAQARQAKVEFGFFATRNVRSSPGYTAHPAFTSGIDRKILGVDIVANTPGSISVYDLSPVYVHTHQNNPPPSPASDQDGISASAQGLPVVAIDRAGTMTCRRPKQ